VVLGGRRPRYAVQLIDEPVAAAAGAGLDLSRGQGGFVIDVGGGTTEVAAVAGWRVVRASSLRMAGNAMDDAIMSAARAHQTTHWNWLTKEASTKLRVGASEKMARRFLSPARSLRPFLNDNFEGFLAREDRFTNRERKFL